MGGHLNLKRGKEIRVSNDEHGQFNKQTRLTDLPFDDMKAILDSLKATQGCTSIEDAASIIDQKLKQSSSSYRNGDYQIVITELSER